ncbi:hypothetical protein [Paenibacillus sp. GCM10012303]|uniref:hypothetical protein n=1 Tax=Paenibacillus sp. GCM10012303 TaxID=3317340 RepID=UPI0036D37422
MPPAQMIEKSDVIVTGKVEQLQPSKEKQGGQEAVILIHRVLKQPESFDMEPFHRSGVTVKEFIYTTGAVIQAIPPVGTEVMVLLQVNNGELSFTSDSNNIAVIQNNRVTESYRGTNSTEHPYTETYNQFLQDHPLEAGEEKLWEDSEAVPPTGKQPGQYAAIGAGSLLLVLVLAGVWYGIRRSRRSKPPQT